MYSDYQQPTTSKKKIILVSVLMGLIILALIAVLVNAIIRRNRLALGSKNNTNSGLVLDKDGNLVESESSASATSGNGANGETSVSATGTSNESKTDNEVATHSDSAASASSANPTSGSASADAASKTSTDKDNLPTTGPAETFGLTLLLGTVAMYLASRKLARA